MALLSINVMAAVLVRYPWKRKQTGFIITHAGIEILLLGCLLSFRYSVDGKVSLQPGQKSEVIKLNDEEVGVDMADAGGKVRRHVFPVNLWKEAGYPNLAKFIAGSLHLSDLPEEARWPEGHTAVWPLGDGAKLEVLDWQPAAVPQIVLKRTPDGFPAAVVHLGGHLPNGMPMDQTINLLADGQGQGMVRPFGGTLELTLWKARSDAEVDEFLHPPKPEDLPEMGRLAIHLDGKRYTLDVKKEQLGKDAPLGDSGYKAAVEDYILHPPPPQLPENHGQAAMASEPVDPQVSLRLTGPTGVKKYLVAAWHPQFMAHLEDSDVGHHGSASAGDPLVYYSHPQAYFTTKEGTRGRLQLLQALDGKLYVRMFQLQRDPSQKPGEPFELRVGREMQNFWLNISLNVVQHAPSAVLVNEFRPAHVEPRQMDDHPRAMRVALTVDGQRQEAWLEREAGQVELTTPRPRDDRLRLPGIRTRLRRRVEPRRADQRPRHRAGRYVHERRVVRRPPQGQRQPRHLDERAGDRERADVLPSRLPERPRRAGGERAVLHPQRAARPGVGHQVPRLRPLSSAASSRCFI